MKQWEYKVIDSKVVPGAGLLKKKKTSDLESYLNELGQQGWEIINLDFLELESRYSFVGVAKREIVS